MQIILQFIFMCSLYSCNALTFYRIICAPLPLPPSSSATSRSPVFAGRCAIPSPAPTRTLSTAHRRHQGPCDHAPPLYCRPMEIIPSLKLPPRPPPHAPCRRVASRRRVGALDCSPSFASTPSHNSIIHICI
jgi:hypothetical protein